MSSSQSKDSGPAAHAASDGESDANVMWGGRFEGGPAESMQRINASIDFDRRLYAQDIAASKAHCQMLARQSIISPEDGEAILQGLDTILREIEAGEFTFERAL
jgi:argininosuccinate lyase